MDFCGDIVNWIPISHLRPWSASGQACSFHHIIVFVQLDQNNYKYWDGNTVRVCSQSIFYFVSQESQSQAGSTTSILQVLGLNFEMTVAERHFEGNSIWNTTPPLLSRSASSKSSLANSARILAISWHSVSCMSSHSVTSPLAFNHRIYIFSESLCLPPSTRPTMTHLSPPTPREPHLKAIQELDYTGEELNWAQTFRPKALPGSCIF